ncbi:MAG TPA: hypothetical protein VLG67_00075 [Candidatus Saccharimonadales bacterium]|nr:hypothetical protein [Candidatus Saccharimonadales bacterium]
MSDSEAVKPSTPAAKKSSPWVKVIIALVVVFAIGFIVMFAGAMFVGYKVAHNLKQNGVQYNATDKSFTFKDKNGNTAMVGAGATLPKDFPKDFPIYPGAKVISAITVTNAESITFDLNGKDATEVAKWYDQKLTRAGWTADPHEAGSQLMHVTKGSTDTLLLILSDKGKTLLKVTLSKK